ncbi:MAG: DUF6526 family protein [Bacteroidota bacterium]
MAAQNFRNHSRMHPFYHYGLMPLSLGGLVFSGIQLFNCGQNNCTSSILFFLTFLLLFGAIALVRIYALKVQDRVIRSEENFRHFLLTGKPLDAKLRSGQIIALRFASDAEFPVLAQRAVSENLTAKQIKESIQDWRADYRRV